MILDFEDVATCMAQKTWGNYLKLFHFFEMNNVK